VSPTMRSVRNDSNRLNRIQAKHLDKENLLVNVMTSLLPLLWSSLSGTGVELLTTEMHLIVHSRQTAVHLAGQGVSPTMRSVRNDGNRMELIQAKHILH